MCSAWPQAFVVVAGVAVAGRKEILVFEVGDTVFVGSA